MRVDAVALVLTLWTAGCDGCAGASPSASGAGTGGEAATGADTTPSAATAGTHVSSGVGSTENTSTDGTSGTTSSLVPDLPPFPAECFDPSPTIVVEQALSPRGPLSFDEAWLDTDDCTSNPTLRLRDTVANQGVLCVIDGAQPLLGTYECWVDNLGDARTVSIEVLETYDDPNPDHANAGVHLHARIEAQGGGWDVRVEVDVPDCGERDCYCPCE